MGSSVLIYLYNSVDLFDGCMSQSCSCTMHFCIVRHRTAMLRTMVHMSCQHGKLRFKSNLVNFLAFKETFFLVTNGKIMAMGVGEGVCEIQSLTSLFQVGFYPKEALL